MFPSFFAFLKEFEKRIFRKLSLVHLDKKNFTMMLNCCSQQFLWLSKPTYGWADKLVKFLVERERDIKNFIFSRIGFVCNRSSHSDINQLSPFIAAFEDLDLVISCNNKNENKNYSKLKYFIFRCSAWTAVSIDNFQWSLETISY